MHIQARILAFCATVMIFAVNLPVAHASAWGSIKSGASDAWNFVKEKGSDAVDAVQEHGPEWAEAAKDKAGELIDAGKEKVPDIIDSAKEGIQNAQDKVSDWNAAQQDEFWERTEDMLSGGAASSTQAAPAPSSAPTSAPVSEGQYSRPEEVLADPNQNYYQPEEDKTGASAPDTVKKGESQESEPTTVDTTPQPTQADEPAGNETKNTTVDEFIVFVFWMIAIVLAIFTCFAIFALYV